MSDQAGQLRWRDGVAAATAMFTIEHWCRRCAPRAGDHYHQCPGCAPREVEAADDLGGEAAWEHLDPAHRLTMARSQQIKRGE